MRPLAAHCHLGIARSHAAAGERADADTHLARAVALYDEIGMASFAESARHTRRSF